MSNRDEEAELRMAGMTHPSDREAAIREKRDAELIEFMRAELAAAREELESRIERDKETQAIYVAQLEEAREEIGKLRRLVNAKELQTLGDREREQALRDIAHYEEPSPQDPSDSFDALQDIARAALDATGGQT